MDELVSCVLPTTPDRSELVKLAIKCFDNQTYSNKELIIIDSPGTIGDKLNQGCEKAKGSIICRIDSDDWFYSKRLADQVSLLKDCALTGYNGIYFWDTIKSQASYYRGSPNYCLGTSMCFLKSYWQKNRFENTNLGEDLFFQKRAKADNQIVSFPADFRMVARLHGSNISSSKVSYLKVDKSKLPQQFFIDMEGI